MMRLDDYRSKLRDKNSRFKDRLYIDFSTSELVEASTIFLSSKQLDLEISTLIDHELRKRRSLDKNAENVEACKEIYKNFKEAKLKPIEWLYRARVRLRKIHNSRDAHGTFCVYVILMDWVETDDNYGVYVGQTRKLPEDRFAQHKRGEKAGRNVQEKGKQLLWSLMPYGENLLKAKTRRKFEGAVHHCLASVKAKGFKKGLLKVGGDGKNENPDEWPGNFQIKLRNFLKAENNES